MKLFAPYLLILLTIVGLYAGKAEATHFMGVDIRYKNLGNLEYEIIIEGYRDCRGIALSPIIVSIRDGSGKAVTGYTATLTSIKDISPVCQSMVKPCNPTNTKQTGQGVEKHTFIDTIRLDSAMFKGQDRFTIETGQCCRNNAITTGAANKVFYSSAEVRINPNQTNTSPVFYEMPFMIMYTNVPFRRNFGGYDLDGDSLVYELRNPQSGYKTDISYNGFFSKDKPFTVYNPSGSSTANPKADPPEGFHFDPRTGFITFTPTKAHEVSVVSMKVKEYRNGKLLSITHREMQFWVMNGLGEIVHTVSAPDEICLMEGDSLSFDVLTSDAGDTTLVAPMVRNTPDSVFLSWKNPFSGPSFKIRDTFWQHGSFTWKTKVGDGRDHPYVLSFEAIDNACPLKSTIQKTVVVYVLAPVQQPRVSFTHEVRSGRSYFTNTTQAQDSVTQVNWYVNGTLVSSNIDMDSILTRDITNTIKLVVRHKITDYCGNTYTFVDSTEDKVFLKSCEAKYIIGVDTNKTSSFRVYLINLSSSYDSSKWYFSDGDSVVGNGFHRFQKFGKYEVCLKVWNQNCSDVFCDSVGMDSMGNLYKAQGFTIIMVNDEKVGIEETTIPEVSVYPVPFSDRLNVRVSSGYVERVRVSSIEGKTVYEARDLSAEEIPILTREWKSGMYILRLITDTGTTLSRKIVKQQ
ncbi:MAG: T9SS type A sorting domain-containing protein [Bacteroidia bacterium]|nr:T9SS type A sorting domain-containing protein [Bacteroidia bacterium]